MKKLLITCFGIFVEVLQKYTSFNFCLQVLCQIKEREPKIIFDERSRREGDATEKKILENEKW